MSNTKFHGVSLNIEQLNQSLRLKLEKVLSAQSKPETSMNLMPTNLMKNTKKKNVTNAK